MKDKAVKIKGLEEVFSMLNELHKRSTKLEPIAKEIGNMILNETELSFENQKSPFGKKWKPNKTKPKNNPNKQILIKEGMLKRSFTIIASDNEVSVGTNIIYAAIHQFGGKAGRGKKVTIPARPFMPVSNSGQLEESLQKAIASYLSSKILD